MIDLSRPERPRPTREEVEARFQEDVALFGRLVYRLNREEPIERWTKEDRAALLIAIMPEDNHVEGPGFWRWTIEGDKGNRLLKHLVFLARKKDFVGVLRAERDAIPAELEARLATAAELIRAKLAGSVKLWSLVSDRDRSEAA